MEALKPLDGREPLDGRAASRRSNASPGPQAQLGSQTPKPIIRNSKGSPWPTDNPKPHNGKVKGNSPRSTPDFPFRKQGYTNLLLR